MSAARVSAFIPAEAEAHGVQPVSDGGATLPGSISLTAATAAAPPVTDEGYLGASGPQTDRGAGARASPSPRTPNNGYTVPAASVPERTAPIFVGGGCGEGGGGLQTGLHHVQTVREGKGVSNPASRFVTPLSIDTLDALPTTSAADHALSSPPSLPPTPDMQRQRYQHQHQHEHQHQGHDAPSVAVAAAAELVLERRREKEHARMRREQQLRYERIEEEARTSEAAAGEDAERRARETQVRKEREREQHRRKREVEAARAARRRLGPRRDSDRGREIEEAERSRARQHERQSDQTQPTQRQTQRQHHPPDSALPAALPRTPQATLQKLADLESLVEYLKWELAGELKAGTGPDAHTHRSARRQGVADKLARLKASVSHPTVLWNLARHRRLCCPQRPATRCVRGG